MASNDYKFRSVRLDQSPYLFHFTKGTKQDAKNSLTEILSEQKLKSEKGYICFTASPVTSILKFLKTTVNGTGLPLYQSYGIGFSRDIMIRDYSARNLIYCSKDELYLIPDEFKWRAGKLEIGEYDFEYLREWRIKGRVFDFSSFPKEHIIVIAPTKADLNDLVLKNDLIFNPVVSPDGDIDPDWDEKLVREWKGIALENLPDNYNDYSLSGDTASQRIGEDLFDAIYITGSTCALK